MTSDKKPNVRVLTDKVADKDELGSHQGIAESIAGLIKSDQAGKCIALTGSWGSGKSSVVGMVRQLLSSTTPLFVFDAWAHERDPLHRSFLEKLIDFLEKPKWIKKSKWEEKKEQLSKRRETTEIKHHRKPTILGYVLSVVGLAVPLGLVILNQEPWDKLSDSLFWWGIVLTLLPLGMAALCWVISFLVKNEDKKRQLRFVLSSDSREDFRSDTYRTADPTTIEFQEDYRELLRESLSDGGRMLVIVVDNLDRMDAKNALAMWASMKTFLDHSFIEGEVWSDRLWLLVPFDPIAMKAFWNGNGLSQPEEEHGDLASSFIDKTFQVTFHIPPPVLSNWIEFFETKLQWALPDIEDKTEIHDVCRIFRLKKFSGTSYPTPREIKIFINRIGALYRQWHDQFSLCILAMYAVIESKGNVVQLLRGPDQSYIRPVPAELLGQDISLSLAAIHFNVPKEKAAHVLLGPKLEQHVSKRESKGLGSLQQVAGFSDVIEEIIETNHIDWSKESPSTICWLANCLDTMPPGQPSTIRIWCHLCRGASRVESWQNLNEDIGKGITRLLDHDKSEEFATDILRSLSRSEPQVAEESESVEAETLKAWVDGCSKVLESTSVGRGREFVREKFKCPGDAQTYYAIFREAVCNGFPVHLIQYMVPAANPKNIVETIGKVVSTGGFSALDASAIEHLDEMQLDWPWATLAKGMETRLQAPTACEPTEVCAVLGTLIALSSTVKEADSGLSNLAVAGHCLHHLHTTHNQKHSGGTALCMYVMLKRNPVGTVAAPVGNSAAGQKVFTSSKTEPATIEYALEDLAGLFIETGDASALFDELRADESLEKLRLAIISRIPKRSNAVVEISIARFVSYEADFFNALSPEAYQQLVDRFVVDGELVEYLGGQKFEANKASLYGAAYVSSETTPELLGTWLLTGLADVTEKEWTNDLNTTHYNLYDLLHAMRVRNVAIELRMPFRNALIKYRDSLTQETTFKRDLSKGWTEMLDCLHDSIRKTFIQGTIDIIVGNAIDHASTIALFGPFLLDCELLDAKKDDLVQRGFSRFIDEDRVEELRWFASAVSKCPDLIKKCRKENRDTLKEHLEFLLRKTDLDDEKRDVLSDIAGAIGVPIPSSEEENTDNSASSAD